MTFHVILYRYDWSIQPNTSNQLRVRFYQKHILSGVLQIAWSDNLASPDVQLIYGLPPALGRYAISHPSIFLVIIYLSPHP